MHTKSSLVSFCIVLFLASGVRAETGFVFDVSMVASKKDKPDKPVIFKTTMLGNSARIDIPMDRDDWKKGDYLLTTDGGMTYSLVSPSRKTVRNFDQASLRAMTEEENKGISINSLETAWSSPLVHMKRLDRHYNVSFRQGFISGKGRIEEVHEYSLAEPKPGTPAFNPFIEYMLMDVASPLLKDKTFESAGIRSVLPGGFIEKAVLHLKSKIEATPIGKEEKEQTVTFDSSVPAPTEVPPALFAMPTDYKVLK